MTFEKHMEVAKQAAYLAGECIRRGFDNVQHIEMKQAFDPVTEFDKQAEDIICGHLLAAFPDHGILAEEHNSRSTSSEYRWIVDPIDGTVNFTRSIPLITSCIALEYRFERVISVLYNPILNEMYYAHAGQGAYKNDSAIHVSRVENPHQALIAVGWAHHHDSRFVDAYMQPLKHIATHFQGMRRLGAASMNFIGVAQGNFEAFYGYGLKPWDIAAGSLLVQEAGGKLSDFCGHELQYGSAFTLGSNGLMHADMVQLLQPLQEFWSP